MGSRGLQTSPAVDRILTKMATILSKSRLPANATACSSSWHDAHSSQLARLRSGGGGGGLGSATPEDQGDQRTRGPRHQGIKGIGIGEEKGAKEKKGSEQTRPAKPKSSS